MEATPLKLYLGQLEPAVRSAIAEAAHSSVVSRIWQNDPSLWTADEPGQRIISNSLGWLTVPNEMIGAAAELKGFANEVQQAGFKHVMVCGMGGSSLCPEVLARTFGRQLDAPELLVLDSTDPDVIAAFAERIDLSATLFVIASKSGTTTEPLCFYKYWFERVRQQIGNPGDAFVAITDPGTPLLEEARAQNFRRVFVNQPNIGGRYSALSYFGMVPAALMGLDVGKLLLRASNIAKQCGPEVAPEKNPGLLLGCAMAEAALGGRDKLTLLIGPAVASLGLWIEQLVAESTGKHGKGILPVDNEAFAGLDDYESDRFFVAVQQAEIEHSPLVECGHPVGVIAIEDLYDLGAQFFVWEFATAVAGWRLQINPFDQPNVQESKDVTRELLQAFTSDGTLPPRNPFLEENGLTFFASDESSGMLPKGDAIEILRAHLRSAQAGEYVALLNYFEETPAHEEIVQALRRRITRETHRATTAGYGPRFLHSTGQLHKGGANNGVFLQLTAGDESDLAIPGESYSFSVLKQAQALGDFSALSKRGRRALSVDLGPDATAGLQRFAQLIDRALVST